MKKTLFDRKTEEINELLTTNGNKLKIIENNRKFIRFTNDVLISKSNKPEYKVFLLFLKPFLRERKLKDFDEYYNIFTDNTRKNEILSNLKKEIQYESGNKGYSKSNGKGLLEYRKNNPAWNKGKKTGIAPWNKGKTKYTDARLENISKLRIGEGNPVYGKKYTQQEKDNKSILMKKLILEGKFTPNTNNSKTYWDSTYGGKKYRSSWEVMFKILNPAAEYESLRLEYFDTVLNKTRVTIVDFVDHTNKIVTEVKPTNMLLNENTLDKIEYIKLWCNNNGYKFQTFTEIDVKKHIKEINMDILDPTTRRKLEKYL